MPSYSATGCPNAFDKAIPPKHPDTFHGMCAAFGGNVDDTVVGRPVCHSVSADRVCSYFQKHYDPKSDLCK